MMRFLAILAILIAAVAAAPAFAGQPVSLRGAISAPGGQVTLGDLFDDAGAAAKVIVASGGRPGGNLILDAGRVQAVARSRGLDWDNPQGLQRIIARTGGQGYASAPAPRTSAVRASAPRGDARVLTYVRDIAAGELVDAQDIVWAPLDGRIAPQDTPRDPDMIIGQQVKRPLRQGAIAETRDVTAPQVIKRDDIVSVTYEADGMKLTLQGKAMAAAGVGQVVDVMNLGSKKTIQAVATGPGEAVVGPEADRLKAARGDPRLLASLR